MNVPLNEKKEETTIFDQSLKSIDSNVKHSLRMSIISFATSYFVNQIITEETISDFQNEVRSFVDNVTSEIFK